jgi:Xaa-Pro aminopeptidase
LLQKSKPRIPVERTKESDLKEQRTMKNPSSRPKSDPGISRRDLLQGASVGIAGSLGASLLPALGYGQRPGRSAAAPAPGTSAAALTPVSMPKGFSKDEYPQRWRKLRALMKEKNLDALLVPGTGGVEYPDEPSDVMYLTGSGGGWVVFSLDGKVVVINGNGTGGGTNEIGVESHADGRAPGSVTGNAEGGQWSPALIDVLREKGMSRARIGIGDLAGVPRNEEGGVSYTTLDRIIKAFPQAKFESAVDVMTRLKLARSPQEIATMEKADAVAELGVQAMLETARPGVPLMDLWIKMYETMLRASGEAGSIAFTLSGAGGGGGGAGGRMLGSYTGPHAGPPSSDRVLRAGQVMNQEITGRVMGYGMQVNHGVCIGSPAPPEWEPAAKYCIEVFDELLDFIAPGKTVKELNAFYAKLMEGKGWEKTDTTVIFHFGEGPRMGPNRKEGQNLVVEEGWVFHTLKPTIPMPKLDTFARFGDGVVVTDKGARRLGKRKLEVVSLGV